VRKRSGAAHSPAARNGSSIHEALVRGQRRWPSGRADRTIRPGVGAASVTCASRASRHRRGVPEIDVQALQFLHELVNRPPAARTSSGVGADPRPRRRRVSTFASRDAVAERRSPRPVKAFNGVSTRNLRLSHGNDDGRDDAVDNPLLDNARRGGCAWAKIHRAVAFFVHHPTNFRLAPRPSEQLRSTHAPCRCKAQPSGESLGVQVAARRTGANCEDSRISSRSVQAVISSPMRFSIHAQPLLE